MIDEICRYLNNWFDRNSDGTDERYYGTFVISDGVLDLSETSIMPKQYFRIVGSRFNDGVYKYEPDLEPTDENQETHRPVLTDEVFNGAIWGMHIPASFIALASDIEAWQEKYGGIDNPSMSPYNSESFGGYSYSKSGAGSSGSLTGGSGTWQGVFASQLNKYRKIRAI